jgi:epoxide hydrolase-like predicted phosphatase
MYRAVIFDLGGVVFPSPFDAVAAYESDAGLAPGTVRELVRRSSEDGAWAALERGELALDECVAALEAEAARTNVTLDARRLLTTIGTPFGPRPEMVAAVRRIREEGLRTAALTNNWPTPDGRPMQLPDGLAFDVLVESARVGLRKPDRRIYELVLGHLGVEARDAVFLDDLGINLKPARDMGMTTIKVTDAGAALAELAAVLGFPVA